ncbi:MAG: restriction endonuclease subunit S [Bacteroidales bacterium]|nr:restriction endonuclease subunit S [Bacteroidales bacterium]
MTTKTNIQAGYKDSSVGVIPQEWEVASLGKLVSITSGESPSLFNLREIGKYPYIKVEDMNNCEKYQLLSREYTDDERCAIQKGSIIFPKRGAAITNNKVRIAACQLYMDSNMMAIMPNDFVCGDYLYFKITYEQLFRIADTSTIPQINNKHIIPYKICLPPLAEQRKIAEILGAWDEAIEKQSRLIEKLELRKRALMQRLLTGRTRLLGFTSPWQKVSYSEILKEVKRNMTWDDNEEYDLISVKRRSGGLFHRNRLLGKDIKTKNLRPAKFGDFLISKMQIVHGASGLVTEEFDGMKISGSYIALVAKSREKVDMNFINWYSQTPYFYHQTYVSSYGVHIEKMTFDLESFMSMNIMLPPLPEQKAIAEVLTAADNEIVTHRKKLDALRLQKRGLMQQLLTGKTRVKI